MKLQLASLGAIFCIPVLALALEPSDPHSFCDRFVGEDAIEDCQKRAGKENIDWYGASFCNMQKEDDAFWKCWNSAKDKTINLPALKKCEEAIDASDEQRQACLDASLNKSRSPASTDSNGLFQPLNPKKKK